VPSGPGLPPGRYRDSCQGCWLRQEGSVLECSHCRTAAGQQVEASAADVQRCEPPGDLDNRDGKLLCSGLQNAPDVPDGPYLESCQGCRLEAGGAALACSHCDTPGGRQHAAGLDLLACPPGAAPENILGGLSCGSEVHAPGIPPGRYATSCKSCTVADGRLACASCLNTFAKEVVPEPYSLERCPAPGVLDNRDGVLACAELPSAEDVPAGAYSETCQGCRLEQEGAVLACSHCSRANNTQVAASYELAQCPPPGQLHNHDGGLACKGGPTTTPEPPAHPRRTTKR